MKKLLSIVLSVLMVVSCMTCLFTSPAGVASAASPSATVVGENLLADLAPEDFVNVDGNKNHVANTQITVGEETIDAIRLQSQYQKFYFTLNLIKGVEYTLNFTIQGNVKLEGFRVYKLSDLNDTNSSAGGTDSYLVDKHTGGTDITTAKSYTYTFTPAETTDYIFRYYFTTMVNSEGENYNYLYNYSLTTETEVSAKVEGNGAASATAGESTVTFTATPYGDSSFLGWYDAEGTNLLGKDATYTYTGEVVPNPVTAKFNGVNLAAGVNTPENWNSYGWTTFTASTESNLGGDAIVTNGVAHQAQILTLTLKPNTEYSLDFYVKSGRQLETSLILNSSATFKDNSDGGKVSNSSASKVETVSSAKDVSSWTKLSVTFTTAASENETDTYYLYTLFNGTETSSDVGNKMYVSDISLYQPLPKYNVTATADGNGTASVSAATATEGTEVTFTATAFDGEQFLGWYNGEDLVSEEATHTVTVGTANVALTAKFTKINLAGGLNVASNWKKGTYSWATISDDAENSGVKFSGTIQSQTVYLPITLKTGTSYNISFKFKTPHVVLHELRVVASDMVISDNQNNGGMMASGTSLKNIVLDGKAYITDWTEYNASFDVPASENETEVCYLYVKWNGTVSSDAQANSSLKVANIKELKVVELIPEYDVKVSAEGNGTVSASAATVEKGKDVTVTATAKDGAAFLGWYNGDTIVTTDTTYTTTVTADLNLVAKFTGINLAAGLNNVQNWKKGSYVTISDSAESGIEFTGTVNWQAAYLPITLKKGATYNISFKYKSPDVVLNGIRVGASDMVLNASNENEPGIWKSGTVIKHITTPEKCISDWTEYSASFTVPTDENLTGVCNIYIRWSGKSDTATTQIANLKDLLITEVGGADIEMADFKGNSIRATGLQALRFRFNNVNNDLFDAYASYTVKEFGALAIRTKYLGSNALTVDGEYTYSGKDKAPVKGTFTSTDIAEDGTISLALFNLGTIKYADGNIKSTDYTAYGEDYTVRMYAVLVNPKTQEEITVYGAEQTANVFAVMNAILSSTADDEQTTADKTAIETILASADEDSAGNTVKALYDKAYPQQ